MTKKKKVIFYYSLCVILCLFFYFNIVTNWQFNFKQPLFYWGDALFSLVQFKSLALGDWYPFFDIKSPVMGAPFGYDMGDFPHSDNLNYGVIKLLSFFSKDPVVLANLFFLLCFPASAVSFLFMARKFRISYPISLVFGILFAFLPFHLRRFAHLFLSNYSLMPLMTVVIFWLWSKQPLFIKSKNGEKLQFCFNSKKAVFSIAVALCMGASGVYWGFFSLFFVAVAGVSAWYYRKNKNHLIAALILGSILVGSLGIGGLPTLYYQYKNGKNELVSQRGGAVAAEIFALKFIHIVLPQGNHRMKKMRSIREHYQSATMPTEGDDEAAGWFAVMGFGILLLHLLVLGRKNTVFDKLSILFTNGLLFGTIAGLGAIFAKAISPSIRCYNRISVYLALFGLLSMAIASDRLRKKLSKPLGLAFCLLVLTIGVYDQITPDYKTAGIANDAEYQSDHDFVEKIEAQMTSSSNPFPMILQLPYIQFPESPTVVKMTDYSHFKGPIHSRNLRWSYGAVKGRPGAAQIAKVSEPPLDLTKIKEMGYVGVYIDRFGFQDEGRALEQALAKQTKQPPIVSANQRLSFFPL